MKTSKLHITSVIAILIFMTATSTYAQISKVHTFDDFVYFGTGYVYNTPNFIFTNNDDEHLGLFYKTQTDIENSQYIETIYNTDFTVKSQHTYNFTPPEGYTLQQVTPTYHIFNNDDDIEFAVIYIRSQYTAYDNSYSLLHLYNQKGELIYDFGRGNSMTFNGMAYLIDNQAHILVYRYYYDYKNEHQTETIVYKIDGVSSEQAIHHQTPNYAPYPNPSSNIINLPYTTQEGNSTTMNIFNSNGNIIEQIPLSTTSHTITLNTTSYTPGVYFYEVNGISRKFIVH